jgi:hypothetical protein
MHGIRRTPAGYEVSLAAPEQETLRTLSLDLVAELTGGTAGETDPGLERLFPPASRNDEETAAEFERLARPGLEEGKLTALRELASSADTKLLDEDAAQTWLRAINDLRLVHGVRLNVREDDSVWRLREPRYRLYAWLTWLQSELLAALGAA